ncbi:DUF2073 domain-containing protein [Candidatus Woesearchaeota archaeon]|nr:DUF2073 domain-containing protein [Candidatus Woesearchaeota archaeon]
MLTLQFIPYAEIEDLTSEKRISKLLNVVKENKIVVLEGRLRKEEEADLIKQTMESIDEDFKGIELSVIFPDMRNKMALDNLRKLFINLLLGDRTGITIIGPASVVKEIKKDPNKIELLTQPLRRKKKR